MSVSLAAGGARSRRHPRIRLRQNLSTAGQVVIGVAVLIWTIIPLYTMVQVALEPKENVFNGAIWPVNATLGGFWTVLTQDYWYLAHFWREMGNSLYIGVATSLLTLLIGTLTSFVVGRMRIRHAWVVSNAALLTYVIPMSFLAIPFYRLMQSYGLGNTLWAVIAVEVTFATPYAIFIFTQYGSSIPLRTRRGGADRRRLTLADLLARLSAADAAVDGGGRHICAAACLERVSLHVPAAVQPGQDDCAGGARAFPQQR